MKATNDEMVAAVKAHATNHYEEGGWDYIVECWEDEEILSELVDEKITTVAAAIKNFKEVAAIYAERRSEVESTAW